MPDKKRILILCPYPQGVAAGQRLKYEQYIEEWESLGWRVDISPFIDTNTWEIAYKSGNLISKIIGVFKGHLRRINDLFRIRKEIELDGKEFSEAISSKLITKKWGNLVGESLKTFPRGFSKDHEYISLLRRKSFLFKKNYSDEEIISKHFIHKLYKDFLVTRTFLDYMSNILTTDLNGISLIK